MDEYEEYRPEGDRRRGKQEMLVPARVREDWLRTAGYSRGEMKEAVEDVARIQRSSSTHMMMKNKHVAKVQEKLQETHERVQRKVQRWIFRDPPKRALYDQWLEQQQQNNEHEQQENNNPNIYACPSA